MFAYTSQNPGVKCIVCIAAAELAYVNAILSDQRVVLSVWSGRRLVPELAVVNHTIIS